MLAHAVQYWADKQIDAPKQVSLRNTRFQPKLIKQTRLVTNLSPHHRRPQGIDPRNQRNHCSARFSSPFSTPSVESRCGAVALGRAYLLPPLSSGGALVVPPWLRFHIPLIEPDRQICRVAKPLLASPPQNPPCGVTAVGS